MHQIKDKRLSQRIKEKKKKDPTACCFQKVPLNYILVNGTILQNITIAQVCIPAYLLCI